MAHNRILALRHSPPPASPHAGTGSTGGSWADGKIVLPARGRFLVRSGLKRKGNKWSIRPGAGLRTGTGSTGGSWADGKIVLPARGRFLVRSGLNGEWA